MTAFHNARTNQTAIEILDRLDNEADEAAILGMYFREQADMEQAEKYEARSEALNFIYNCAVEKGLTA
jgi:hypothetical protein